jgi:RecB family exonuclease
MSACEGLTFDEEKHEYRLDGRVIPSVTQVLKAAGMIDDQWFDEWSRERGKAVHKATELNDRGELDESTIDPRIAGYLDAWRRFIFETGWKSNEIEKLVFSRFAWFAGTLDRIGRFPTDRGLSIVDIKTGTPTRADQLQVAAYEKAYNSMDDGIRCGRSMAVYLRENGTYTKGNEADYQRDVSVFLAALTVSRWKGLVP